MSDQALRRVGPDFERRWPQAEALATNCAINLTLLSSQLGQFSQALCEQHGLPSPAAFNLLAILDAAGTGMAPSQIAARMLVARPTVSGILRSLSDRGLIRLAGGQADGRKRLVTITAAGQERLAEMFPDLHRRERQFFACLSMSQKRQFLVMIGRLLNNFPDLSQPG